ncbi:MAG: UDP-N-acetylmuramoyl-L-alanyl-D-glutamate--2,6-diaminopimelate ligase, partial [Phycisphaerae bacterium]
PVRKLTCVGITGTNGKTTVAHLIRAVLAAAGHSPALLGTISYETPRGSLPAGTTTPDPITLADLTAEMAAGGCSHLVMEASSHALDQRRVAGVEFRVGVFTNLSGDHLDYHDTMARYKAAKRRLFEELSGDAVAVINRDDPAGEDMASATKAAVRWYGLSPAADLWARIDRIDSTGTDFTFVGRAGEVRAHTPLIGRHNVFNCLAAASACEALGVELTAVADVLANVRYIPGRLQRVEADAPFQVFVDYAHTDDALRNVLSSLRPVTRGRLVLVFGCGGDRDRTKRPRMARVAEELADDVVITSDNPRSERPEAIIEEICAGLSAGGRSSVTIEPDRRKAIGLAVELAGGGDVVLIAGKGHETYQVLGDRRVHFDDVEEAAKAVSARGTAR